VVPPPYIPPSAPLSASRFQRFKFSFPSNPHPFSPVRAPCSPPSAPRSPVRSRVPIRPLPSVYSRVPPSAPAFPFVRAAFPQSASLSQLQHSPPSAPRSSSPLPSVSSRAPLRPLCVPPVRPMFSSVHSAFSPSAPPVRSPPSAPLRPHFLTFFWKFGHSLGFLDLKNSYEVQKMSS
jgi:hypothetical protein